MLLLRIVTAVAMTAAISALIGPSADAVNYCGGKYCDEGEVCCGAFCKSKSECFCKAPKSMCGKSCVDKHVNPKHCGSCGVSCQGLCTNAACVPVSVQVVRPKLAALDLRVSANTRYVLASDGGRFDLRDRSSALAPVTDTVLSGDPAASMTGIQALFRALLYDDTRTNLNKQLSRNAPIPCDWHSPFPVEGPFAATTPPPGIVMSPNKFVAGGKSQWPSSSCVTDLYDMQQTFDTVRQRFWIISHVRNRIWPNSCDVAQSTDKALCQNMNAQALRVSLVAVSKTADPHDGFWTYVVNKDYADQPWQGIHNDYAIFHHNKSSGFHIFDAATMAGTATAPGSASELKVTNAANGKTLQAEKDFQGVRLRVAKHHEGAQDATYIVSDRGQKDVWIYALKSPHPAGKTTLLGPAHYAGPASIDVQEATYSSGQLYLVNSIGGTLSVHRIPVSLADVSAKKEIDPNSVRNWSITKANQNIDYATLDVTRHQDVVVAYRADNKNTMPNLVKYAILYHGESAFRLSRNVVDLPGNSGKGYFALDFVGSQRDTLDPSAVWTLLADENGVVMSSIRP
jgi:hypothetical protein